MLTEQALVFAQRKAGSPAISSASVSPKPMESDVNEHALVLQVQSPTALLTIQSPHLNFISSLVLFSSTGIILPSLWLPSK